MHGLVCTHLGYIRLPHKSMVNGYHKNGVCGSYKFMFDVIFFPHKLVLILFGAASDSLVKTSLFSFGFVWRGNFP